PLSGRNRQFLEPFDLIFAISVVIYSIGTAVYYERWTSLTQPMFLIAMVLLAAQHRTLWLTQTVISSGIYGLLIYSFGRHNVALVTCFPVSRITADQLRNASSVQLGASAVIAAGMTTLYAWTQHPLVGIAILSFPAAVLAMPAPPKVKTNRYVILSRSLKSWMTEKTLNRPGLFQSPAGPAGNRIGLLFAASVLTAIWIVRSPNVSLLMYADMGDLQVREATILRYHDDGFWSLSDRYRWTTVGIVFLLVIAFPSILVIVLVSSVALPTLLDAAAEQDLAERLIKEAGGKTFAPIVSQIRSSSDPIEQKSIYHGMVVADRSPVLVPREIYCEHAHALGDSGGGKTGLFLCPVTEQLVGFGDCSVIVLDLKADSLELLASLQTSVERIREKLGMPMPLQVFSNQNHRHTVAFNPMSQPFWNRFDLLTRTDILCAANGLNYGTDYGQGYYSSANAAVVFHAMKAFPHISSFAELADCIGTVVTTAKRQDLHPEIRKAGIHVHEVMKRLAACEALNVTSTSSPAPEVHESAIDLTRFFQEPQFLYCHLPSTLSPSGAPEIARLFTYLLLAASTQTERKCQVFLVIDEFQRMVANNLQYMLQLARSMGVGIVLANQSMQDLKQGGTNLLPAIEANCRLRQWFSVSSVEDQERLIQISGKTIDHSISRTHTVNGDGKASSSITATEQVVDRLTINDILLTNDHPHRSILRVARGSGNAQFGGMPVVIESDFHISETEYRRRQNHPWPQVRGSFLQKSQDSAATKTIATSGSAADNELWTEQLIDGASSAHLTPEMESQLTSLFDALRTDVSAKSKPTSRRRRQDP
ncbi:MAG: TraM recognition domain-containing protein, partial [Planctomycetaceae bacterium]|nr:TraM recognition domain-containing protein [Planctomycetaceae bacterium]